MVHGRIQPVKIRRTVTADCPMDIYTAVRDEALKSRVTMGSIIVDQLAKRYGISVPPPDKKQRIRRRQQFGSGEIG